MERKICKSMSEFTRINRKRQMLMSHCLLREISRLPLTHWHILQQQQQPLDINHF